MPPLRRMGRRRVADELTRRQEPEPPLFGTTLPDPTTMGRVNGLGDRQRSWSPADDADAWNVLGSTITPDPSLPSASNSFAADVGTSFASSTRENTRNRPSRVERPAIPRGGAVPDPPEASRPRNQYAWDLRENRRAARAMQGRGVRDNHDIETTSARSESPARRTNGGVHEDQHGPTPFIRRQAESPMFGYEAAPRGSAVTDTELSALRDHQTQLLLLEQENRRRILRMRQELRENGQAEPETGGLRQTEITDYCPHEATREGEADDDGSSTTTSTDSMDEYDEADIVDFVASTSRAEPEAANQINMDLVRECDGFLEALRRLISNNNRSTEDVRNIREGLRQLRRLVDLAADRTSRLGDLAALARENGEAAA